MFSYVGLEERIPEDHPLRPLRLLVDAALKELSPRLERLYAKRIGRPSIAPEKLLRALVLQVLHSVRSERLLMEQLGYNLLYRWFVGLAMDERVWDATVFTKNRKRLERGMLSQAFLDAVLRQAAERDLLSAEHFTVDGTVIEAWASQKSVQPKGQGRGPHDGDPGNPTVNFRGEKRSNETHVSTTDPEARLVGRKGKETKLGFAGHLLTENRNGLVVAARLTTASGHAERDAALEMLKHKTRRRWRRRWTTLGADKGYDTRGFVEKLREGGVTPHVAQNTSGRASAIDGRTTRHGGYAVSQRARKRIEEVFGWMKTIGLIRKTRHRGRRRVDWMFIFTAAAYNLVRMRNLLAVA
jgi:transposase